MIAIKVRHLLTLYHTIPTPNNPGNKAFENIVGNGENAGNQHFLLFPHCFSSIPEMYLYFLEIFILLPANLANSKIFACGRVHIIVDFQNMISSSL